jgi:hypothetical protein
MAADPKKTALDLTWEEILQLMKNTVHEERSLQTVLSSVGYHINRRLSDRELMLLIGLGGRVLQMFWPDTRQKLELMFGAPLEAIQADPALRARLLEIDAETLAVEQAKAKSGLNRLRDQKAREVLTGKTRRIPDLERDAAASDQLRERLNALRPRDLVILLQARSDAAPLLTPASRQAMANVVDFKRLAFLNIHETLPSALGMHRTEFRDESARLADWWRRTIDEIAASTGGHPLGDSDLEY